MNFSELLEKKLKSTQKILWQISGWDLGARMKKIKPMILKAEYFPPKPTQGFKETQEDLRRPLSSVAKRTLLRFGLGNLLLVLFILWFVFYLISNSKDHQLSLFLVIVIFSTVTYLFFGLPFIVYFRIQKERDFCRICSSKIVFEQVSTGSIAQTNVICENCEIYSVDTKYSASGGSE